jgi:hypothetical protein
VELATTNTRQEPCQLGRGCGGDHSLLLIAGGMLQKTLPVTAPRNDDSRGSHHGDARGRRNGYGYQGPSGQAVLELVTTTTTAAAAAAAAAVLPHVGRVASDLTVTLLSSKDDRSKP